MSPLVVAMPMLGVLMCSGGIFLSLCIGLRETVLRCFRRDFVGAVALLAGFGVVLLVSYGAGRWSSEISKASGRRLMKAALAYRNKTGDAPRAVQSVLGKELASVPRPAVLFSSFVLEERGGKLIVTYPGPLSLDYECDEDLNWTVGGGR